MKRMVLFLLLAFVAVLYGCTPKQPVVQPEEQPVIETSTVSQEATKAFDEVMTLASQPVQPEDIDGWLVQLSEAIEANRTNYPEIKPDEWDFVYVSACFQRKEYKRCIEAATPFIISYPDSPHGVEVRMFRGYSNYRLGSFPEAAQSYRDIIDLDLDYNNMPLIYYNSAINYFYAESFDECTELFEILIDLYPNDNYSNLGRQTLGLVNYRKADLKAAAACFWDFCIHNSAPIASGRPQSIEMEKVLTEIHAAAVSGDEILTADAMMAYFYSVYMSGNELMNFAKRDLWAMQLDEDMMKYGNAPFAAGPAYYCALLMPHIGKSKELTEFIDKWEPLATGVFAVKFFILRLQKLIEAEKYSELISAVENASEEYLNYPELLKIAVNAAKAIEEFEVLLKYAARLLEINPTDRSIAELYAKASLVGKPAPEIAGVDVLTGNKVSLSALSGKVVLIDFWATWCGPCVRELPNVLAVYEKYHDMGMEILGVSLDQAGKQEKLTQFCKDNGMAWPQIYEGKYWDVTPRAAYGFNGIPFMVLVDRKGIVRFFDKRGEALDPAIAQLIAE